MSEIIGNVLGKKCVNLFLSSRWAYFWITGFISYILQKIGFQTISIVISFLRSDVYYLGLIIKCPITMAFWVPKAGLSKHALNVWRYVFSMYKCLYCCIIYTNCVLDCKWVYQGQTEVIFWASFTCIGQHK